MEILSAIFHFWSHPQLFCPMKISHYTVRISQYCTSYHKNYDDGVVNLYHHISLYHVFLHGDLFVFSVANHVLQIMAAESLQRRLTGKGVTVSALHPGIVSV